MTRQQTLLNTLKTYRKWRDAQRAYAQTVETEQDAATIAAAEEQLQAAYQEYKKGALR